MRSIRGHNKIKIEILGIKEIEILASKEMEGVHIKKGYIQNICKYHVQSSENLKYHLT